MSQSHPYGRPSVLVLFLWLLLAVISSMVGVGGGVFAVPLMYFVYRLPMRSAVATAVLIVFTLSSVATITESLRADSALNWKLVGALVLGALPGSFAGFRTAHHLPQRTLKICFACILTFAAARTAIASPSLGEGLNGNLPPGALAYVIGTGFLAGFSSPLLGVGGGVLAIPLLLLLVPGIRYVEARACSVATTIVSSGVASYLYLNSREAKPKLALPFALVAGVGAVIGVALVHKTGGPGMARWLLVGLLAFLAGRFFLELFRTRARSSAA